MKKKELIFSLIITAFGIIGVFVASLIISAVNNKEFIAPDDKTVYYTDQSSAPVQNNTSSQIVQNNSTSSSVSESQSSQQDTVLGIYRAGDSELEIYLYDQGYMDAKISKNNISMEFGGQAVDNVLTAVGTDSNNNTIELTVTFIENGNIKITSEPIIRYEEANEYLNVSGVFVKQ